MKTIRLSGPKSSAFETIVDDEDYEYLSQFKWHLWADNYVATKKDYASELMHHYVANRVGLDFDGYEIDHKNGNKLDNRRENLRVVTRSLNIANSFRRKDNTSGYKGVCLHKYTGKWQARIGVNGRRVHLGTFDNPVDAHIAYTIAAKRYFGEYARLN